MHVSGVLLFENYVSCKERRKTAGIKNYVFERGGILLPWCLQKPQEAYVMVTSVGIQVDWRS